MMATNPAALECNSSIEQQQHKTNIFSILKNSDSHCSCNESKMVMTEESTNSATVHNSSMPCCEDSEDLLIPTGKRLSDIVVSTDKPSQNNYDASSDTATDNTSPMNSTTSSSRSSVSFGSIQVREYKRALSDNWEVAHGLALDWEYLEHAAEEIEQLPAADIPKDVAVKKKRKSLPKKIFRKLVPKDSKKKDKKQADQRRKSTGSMKTNHQQKPPTWQERSQILKKFGFTREEMEAMEKKRQAVYLDMIMAGMTLR